MKLFLHWKSYPIIKMTKNYRQLLWYPHFERGWISAYWKICAYMQKTATHMRISAWNHIIHNRMPTSNLYVFVWLATVFKKLAKNMVSFKGSDSCQSLAWGWYCPLTHVMIGALWATYPGLQSRRHCSADKWSGCLDFDRIMLTRVGVGVTVQECGVRYEQLLSLATPVAIRDAARFGTGVA